MKSTFLPDRGVVKVGDEMARLTSMQVGSSVAGWVSFQPLYQRIVAEQPDLLD